MATRKYIRLDEQLVVVEATGRIDVPATKKMFDRLLPESADKERYQVLLDLRNVECDMLVSDIRELAAYAAQPNPALPTGKKVAVVVEGREDFEHAELFAFFAERRGSQVQAFEDLAEAEAWLAAE